MIDLSGVTLPVTMNIARSSRFAERTSVMILQHVLPDTRRFVKILVDSGFHVPMVVAKPNSVHAETLAGFAEDGIAVELHSYDTLETTDILDRLVEQAALSAALDERRLVLIDVGGYFGRALANLQPSIRQLILGVVEVTTFGHNRYRDYQSALQVPVISLARSPLKCAEAHIVGDSAVTAADIILRRYGVLIQGRRAGVIGFGFIGEAIAESLKARGLSVSVYDKDPKKLLRASLRGYQVGTEKTRLLAESDIVFSSTGSRAIDYADLAHAKDGLTLVSAGSKSNEFDMDNIRAFATACHRSDPALQEYQTSWGKRLRTLCNGSAVNFYIQSCPEEVMDVVFAEQLVCCQFLAEAPRELNQLHELGDDRHREIAALWLTHYNRDAFGAAEPTVIPRLVASRTETPEGRRASPPERVAVPA